MSAITVDSVAEFIANAVTPLRIGLADEATVKEFVADLGWDLPSVPSLFFGLRDTADAVLVSLHELVLKRSNNQDTAADAAAVTGSLLALAAELDGLESALLNSGLPSSFLTASGIAGALGRRILDSLVMNATRGASAMAWGVLVALGFFEETEVPTNGTFQPDFVLREVKTDRIGKFFGDPSAVLQEVYGWGTPAIKLERLYHTLNTLSVGLHSPAELAFPSDALLDSMFPQVPVGTQADSMINVPIASAGSSALEVAVLPAPKANATELQGLAFRLIGQPQGTVRFGVGLNLELVLTIEAALDTGIGMLLRPKADPQLLVGLNGTAGPLLTGRVTLDLQREDADTPVKIVEFPTGGGIEMENYGIRLQLDAAPPDVAISFAIGGGRVTVSLDKADGFVASVAQQQSLSLQFDLGIGWSQRKGIFITGSAGLETHLVIEQQLGPVFIEGVDLLLKADNAGIRVDAGLDAAITLGPVTASIEGIGVSSLVKFQSGNLGPMNVDSAFKFPTGIGIFIDAGSVAGGGFIRFEPDAGRYSGALDLRIYDIHVKAFGLIETKVPGVPFSFVIVISAEFDPIQLGYGFMLLGIGGLIGINRSIKHDAIADAVSNGRLDHVLFPDDLIGNAPSIINDLGALFPATAGSYAFGPMAKLTWLFLVNGTLGLLLEWPSKKVVIIGTVRAALPRPDDAIVKLKMDVAGELDFPGKHFELRASLDPEGSSAGGYKLSGDMAMLLDWGERPDFALSVGGFNPAYAPPPKFPHLRRMAIELGIEGNPRMTVQGYMALTSNTAQVGAKLDAEWHKYGADVRGYLGFDALIVFSPFHFTATLAGGVHVDFVGVGFDLSISATLSGPAPWRLDGEICVGVWPFEACPDFHIQLTGEEAKATLPPLDPWLGAPTNVPAKDQDAPGLYPAILDLRNWRGVVEAGDFTGVTYLETGAADQKVDPVGTATFMQKAVPLNYDITRFADTTPSRKGELQIQFVAVGGLLAEIKPKGDWFAPGRYHEMTETQKLESPAFEFLNAGVTITSASVRIGTVAPKTISYQTFLMAEDGKTTDLGTGATPTPTQLTGMATATFAARPAARTLGGVRFTDFTLQPKLQHDLVTYRVVTKSTLGNAPGLSTTLTRTQAAWALAGLVGPALSTKQVYQIISNPQLAAS